MCGIVGQIDLREQVEFDRFKRMRDTLIHRGPDGEGIYVSRDGHAALGHRRLSIIDLSERGRQPLRNEDGTRHLVHNGEIYNYRALRRILEDRGHRFRSQTDSEVILHGYEEWGTDVLSRLEGMFAFAILDERTQTLFAARDRFGIKPFYYYRGNGMFAFASELKGILADARVPRDLDPGSVADFLLYRYVPAPKTIWKGIRKLRPAHFLVYDRNRDRLDEHRYWTLEKIGCFRANGNSVKECEDLLEDAVRSHLAADVPVGLFLSGGMDSAALAWFMKETGYDTYSYSMGFSGWPKSEHADADAVARRLETRHALEMIDPGELDLDLAEQTTGFFDEPFAGPSMLPTFALCRGASKRVKVVLGGDGGDEVFGGYRWYDGALRELSNGGSRKETNKEKAFLEYVDRVRGNGPRPEEIETIIHPDFFAFEKDGGDRALRHYFRHDLNPVRALQWMDLHTFLPEICLTKIDRAAMAHSLEVRVPFLDHRLVEWVYSLPERTCFGTGEKKALLKKVLRGKIPDNVLEKPKQGFGANVIGHLDFKSLVETCLDGMAVRDTLFSKQGIESRCHRKNMGLVWTLAVFELWYRRWKR
jgi:asparagine synthase (glutamine-hydrolysing)